MSDCRRTRGLIDRLVEGRVGDEDRRHAATCPACGPVLARAASFDDELRRSARALVAEELPRGILDQALSGQPSGVVSRRAAPGLAAILASAAILLTATIIAIGPGGSPFATLAPSSSPSSSAGPTPAGATPVPSKIGPPFVERFQPTAAIVGQLTKLDYACNDGGLAQSPGPEPDAVKKESAVCTAPDSAGPYVLVVIVGEAANGKVVELTIKGDVLADTTENRTLFTMGIAKVLAIALKDEGAGQNGGSWAKVHVAELAPGNDADVVLRGVSFQAKRDPNGSYHLVVRGSTAS